MNRGNGWCHDKRAQLVKEFGGKCRSCSSTEHLEFAHVRPTGLKGMSRGYNERVLDVLRNRESYVLLCRDCHVRYDLGGRDLNTEIVARSTTCYTPITLSLSSPDNRELVENSRQILRRHAGAAAQLARIEGYKRALFEDKLGEYHDYQDRRKAMKRRRHNVKRFQGTL